MNKKSKQYTQEELVDFVFDTFFMIGDELWRYGESHHKFAKCRIDRDVDDLKTQKIWDNQNISNDRVKFILTHRYNPDIVMRNDLNELIEISPKLWATYRDRNNKNYIYTVNSYMASVSDLGGERQRKTFPSAIQAQEWVSEQREQYRDIFTELNLLSYFK